MKVGVKVHADGNEDPNVRLPAGGFKVQVFGGANASTHLAGILQKVDPSKPFGKFTVTVDARYVVKSYAQSNLGSSSGDYVASGIGTNTNAAWQTASYAQAVSSVGNHQTGGPGGDAFFVTGTALLNPGARAHAGPGGRRQGISQPQDMRADDIDVMPESPGTWQDGDQADDENSVGVNQGSDRDDDWDEDDDDQYGYGMPREEGDLGNTNYNDIDP